MFLQRWFQPKKPQEISRNILLDLVLANFNTVHNEEAKKLFELASLFLKNIVLKDKESEKKFDRIMLGLIVMALVIEGIKTGEKLYAGNDHQQLKLQLNTKDPNTLELFLHEIGNNALSKKIAVDLNHLDTFFADFMKNVPQLKDHLEKLVMPIEEKPAPKPVPKPGRGCCVVV